MFSFFLNNQPKTTIMDNDIKDKTLDEIDTLIKNPKNEFKLSKILLHDVYEKNDINTLEYLIDNFKLELPANGNYHIDKAIEEGNITMAKFLVSKLNCQPSLYAKQMATINGHTSLVTWIDTHTTQRNDIGIANVHRRFDKLSRRFTWSDCIPIEYQYSN